jgi:carboxypeptidase Taq
MHEAGHGLYEQNMRDVVPGLRDAPSMALHESQSRLWENLVGRSRSYWEFYWPKFKELFAEELKGIEVEEWLASINRVERSLVRVEADEVTYNLHVVIRFELEKELLEGKLSVDELPERWSEEYTRLLKCEPKDVSEGVLQDVHWYAASIGGSFQCYTLGNIMAGQLFASLSTQLGDIEAKMARGELLEIGKWLFENIHRWGREKTTDELLMESTGRGLTLQPYCDYLERKFLG